MSQSQLISSSLVLIACRVLAQLELDFNSVERIGEYLDVPQEAPAIVADHRPPAYWPSSNGQLIVENLVVKYAPDLPAVLHNLSFTIRPCEKIGVVRLQLLKSLCIALTKRDNRLAGPAQVCYTFNPTEFVLMHKQANQHWHYLSCG